ncbi:MAG TPA: hypothetical protein VHC50_06255, partial [Puia sp.]|nr:hypothetical protein [Puia sp.]
MKKIALALAVILIAGLSSGYANTTVDVSKRTVAAFRSDFHLAKDVDWKVSEKFVQAQFSMDNKVMFAYYRP